MKCEHIHCAMITMAIVFIPIAVYAHTGGFGGIEYVFASPFFFFCAFLSSCLKRILYVPAKERGIIGKLSILIILFESTSWFIFAVIACLLTSKFEFLYDIIFIGFSVLYGVSAIFINLLLFRNENQRYMDTIKSISNLFNAAIIAMFTPGIFIAFLFLFK
ncbi:hypothetical protein [Desulfosarcina cetonica]|uniref:hypothetical protein n=1 Tax=Desulfosarcina cetonica TaxID=90730 RepID=UPI0012EDEDCA|nr:hypothetical protein [Desulfosarcina cetonica]